MARLYTRTKKNGRKVYCAHICIDKKRYHKSFDSEKGYTIKDRNDWVKMMEYEHRVLQKSLVRKEITLAELIDKYLREEAPTKKSEKGIKFFLNFWKTVLGEKKLDQIKPHHIHSAAVKKNSSPATYNRYVAYLSIVMSYGYFNDLIDDNPCKKIKKKREKSRTRFLEKEELNRLLKETVKVEHLHLIVLIAISTGCRKGEILNMRWQDLKAKDRSIHIPETKNGDPKTVWLRPNVWKLLMKWKEQSSSSRIFPFTDFKRSWHTAMKAADIQGLHFHDLRHTFATFLLAQGVSQFDVMKALGHRNLNSLKVYAHISKERLKEIYTEIDLVIPSK